MSPSVVEPLENAGITNIYQLFPRLLTPSACREFSIVIGVASDYLMDLSGQSDAARVKWLGPKFVGLLAESNYFSTVGW